MNVTQQDTARADSAAVLSLAPGATRMTSRVALDAVDSDVAALMTLCAAQGGHTLRLRDPKLRTSYTSLVQVLRLQSGLTHLDIGGVITANQLGDAGVATLAPALSQLTGLTALNLQLNGIGDAGAVALAASLERLTGLTRLDLAYNNIGAMGAAALGRAMWRLRRLAYAHFGGGNYIGCRGAQSLAPALSQLSCLTCLNLCAMGSGGLSLLAPVLLKLTALTYLHLGSNGLGTAGAASLAPVLHRLTGLTDLTVHDNNIGHDGATLLAPALQRLTCLTFLGVYGNGVGPAAAELLAPALRELTGLTHLDISGNSIGTAGAQSLAPALAHLTALTSLITHSNGIGDAGAASLAQAVGQMSALKYLRVDANGIGDAGAASLAQAVGQMSALTYLSVDGNPINDAGKAKLLISSLESGGVLAGQQDVVWPLVTPGALELAGLPRGIAASWNAFFSYLSELRRGGLCTDGVHASVVLVGHEGAGKTTLASRLATGAFLDDAAPTIGLSTSTEVWEAEAGMKLRLVDCGGHLEYAATHPFFFTNAAVYVLVWGAQAPQRAGIERFLHSIVARVPDALVVVVQSRADEVPDAPAPSVSQLADLFPTARLHPVAQRVSSKDGRGIEDLTAALMSCVCRLSHVASPLPTSYARLGPELRRLRSSLAADGLPPLARASRILQPDTLSRCGFQTVSAAREALRLYHSLGEVVHGGFMPQAVASIRQPVRASSQCCSRPGSRHSTCDESKRSTVPLDEGIAGVGCDGAADDDPLVVLTPQWLADLFAAVVRHDSGSIEGLTDGVVAHSVLAKQWAATSVKATDVAALLAILHGLGVAFPVVSRDGALAETSVVPAILPLKLPQDVLRCAFPEELQRHRASKTSDPTSGILRVHTRHTFMLMDKSHTKFVPLDLLPRLLCRAHAVASVRRTGKHGMGLLWRDGCVYELQSGCIGRLSLVGRRLFIDVRGEYPYYLWRCLNACVQATVSEYKPGSMATQLHLLCPRCDEPVARLDGGRPNRWPALACGYCGCNVDVAPLVDDVCDGVLRRLGYCPPSWRAHGAVDESGDRGGRIRAGPDSLLDVRWAVLASAEALARRVGFIAPLTPHLYYNRHLPHGSEYDNSRHPRCWLAVFNHDTDDSAGVTLHPVCEHRGSVHVCVGAALRAAGVGVAPADAVGLPALEGPALERCAPYLWRVACLVEASTRNNADPLAQDFADRVTAARHRLARLGSAFARRSTGEGTSDGAEWSWPGAEVNLACGSAVLRRLSRDNGHLPGGYAWTCHRCVDRLAPRKPTRYARRLAVVVGVSQYAVGVSQHQPLGTLPRARDDARAVAALLRSGAEFESVLRESAPRTHGAVQWPFGCLGFNRTCDSVETTETTPKEWRDSNVCLVVDRDVVARDGKRAKSADARAAKAVEDMVEAAAAARATALANAVSADKALVVARQALAAARGGGMSRGLCAGAGGCAGSCAGAGASAGAVADAIAAAEARVHACEEAAKGAREVAEAGCLLLLYFSGHGALSSDGNVMMYTGGSDKGHASHYSVERPLLCLMEHTGPDSHCFVAVADCCQVVTRGSDGFTNHEARAYAAQLLCACPPGGVASAEWEGSFSPFTAMLLAEAPVRGISLTALGVEVMRRAAHLFPQVDGGPQQFQGNKRAGDVM